jgi:hypothetical protein
LVFPSTTPSPLPCVDLLDRHNRTIQMETGKRATYMGSGRWETALHVRGRAPRPDGVLVAGDVLPRLREGSFEHEHSLRLIEALGDQP